MQRNPPLDVVWKVLAIKVELKIGGHLNISHGNNDKVVVDQMRKVMVEGFMSFFFYFSDLISSVILKFQKKNFIKCTVF